MHSTPTRNDSTRDPLPKSLYYLEHSESDKVTEKYSYCTSHKDTGVQKLLKNIKAFILCKVTEDMNTLLILSTLDGLSKVIHDL